MGKTYHPGQGNNSYIFPGVALGVLCAGAATIPEEIFLVSAQKLATMVTDADLDIGSLYPPLETIRDCSLKIAVEVMEYAYQNGKSNRNSTARTMKFQIKIKFNFLFARKQKNIGLASVRPEPENKEEFIKSQTYDVTYPSAIPKTWAWPKL